MMGSSQHGHMAAIGYDLYCRMLEDAIKIIKGEIEKEPVETTVDIKVDAYISANFIKMKFKKLKFIRRLQPLRV